MSTDTDTRPVRRGQQTEKREVAFFIRAKTGNGPRDWSPCGVAFARKNGEPGYSVKINTLPLPGSGWTGVMVLVPPFVNEDEPIDE
jgi:hypothetical protein